MCAALGNSCMHWQVVSGGRQGCGMLRNFTKTGTFQNWEELPALLLWDMCCIEQVCLMAVHGHPVHCAHAAGDKTIKILELALRTGA